MAIISTFSLLLFLGFMIQRDDRRWDLREGGDLQQRATGWIRTLGPCSEDTASPHRAHGLGHNYWVDPSNSFLSIHIKHKPVPDVLWG